MQILDPSICQKARLARDPRFDGQFYTAVTTTKIYCRPICPASVPKEQHVIYFQHPTQAAAAGYRPCLRCRPDSAPGSPAWKGVNTTLDRALALIEQGALQQHSLAQLAERLGITDRYLRQLFKRYLGVSPKQYVLYQQCLFAKNLLHQSPLPISQIALAAGFNSIRRFNDCMKKQLALTPSDIRHKNNNTHGELTLKLHYRPPYNWRALSHFYTKRKIKHLEQVDEHSVGRTFSYGPAKGYFKALHQGEKHQFVVSIDIDNIHYLKPVVNNIRRILDLDVDIQAVEQDLTAHYPNTVEHPGLRIPGVWHPFEAGIRAILGQQISVANAHKLIELMVAVLGEPFNHQPDKLLFPTPHSVAHHDLGFLNIPEKRKQTLIRLARHFIEHPTPEDPTTWLTIRGIGPWTVQYAKLRGLSEPDVFLNTDLGIIKALKHHPTLDPEALTPWRSYLTLHLWQSI